MYIKQIDVKKMTAGVQRAISFGMEEISCDYPDSFTKEIHIFKPTVIDVDIMCGMKQHCAFANGGMVSNEFSDYASGNVCISLYNEVGLSRCATLMSHVSLYDDEVVYEQLRKVMIDAFPEVVRTHFSKEIQHVFDGYLNPKDVEEFTQEAMEFETISEKIQRMCMAFTQKVSDSQYDVSCRLTIVSEMNVHIYVDSMGTVINECRPKLGLVTHYDFRNENEIYAEGVQVKYFYKYSDLTQQDFDDLYVEVMDEIEKSQKYSTLKSGRYPLLLKHGAANVFFHEALAAHMLSANYIVDEQSTVFANRLGESIESLQGVDIYMDPTLENMNGSYHYDNEGVKAQKITLIEDGEVVSYLSDRKSATHLEMSQLDKQLVRQLRKSTNNNRETLLKYIPEELLNKAPEGEKDMYYYLLRKMCLGAFIQNAPDVDNDLDWRSDLRRISHKSCGHARVEKWADVYDNGDIATHLAEARMSNLIVDSRQEVSSDLVKEMEQYCIENDKEYYLLIDSGSGQVIPSSGLFNVFLNEVTQVNVKTGERTSIYPGGMISVHLEDFLEGILHVGGDRGSDNGSCGAQSGYVPVSSLVPYVAVKSMPFQAAPTPQRLSDEDRFFWATKSK